VPSTTIHSFDYDPRRKQLRIVFQSGRTYTYQDVPQQTFEQLKAADSKGEFFNAHIRENFRFVRNP